MGYVLDSDSTYYDSVDYNNYTDGVAYESRHSMVFIPVSVAVLSLLGVVGNTFMMFAILKHKHMRTAPNILIFNLAVADMLYILITTPIYVEHEFDPTSGLSTGACKVKNYLACVAQYASAFALAALSRERHTAIVRGIEARQRGSDGCCYSSRFAVATVWTSAFLFNVPTLVFAHTNPDVQQCRISPPDSNTAAAYEFVRCFIGYLIPLSTVVFFYVKIAQFLLHSSQSLQDVNEYVSEAVAHQIRLRKRLALCVLAITIFFAVCWFPYFFYFLWLNFVPPEILYDPTVPNATDVLRYVSLIMPVVNTCLDPWLLFVISSGHRACLLRCVLCRGTKLRGPSTQLTTFRVRQTTRNTGTSISRV